MTDFIQELHPINLNQISEASFERRCVTCLILTQDHKILLQDIVDPRVLFPTGSIATFGGGIEPGETAKQALMRELKEELGAEVRMDEPIFLGAFTEAAKQHTELDYAYFWYDRRGTISGCYEDKAKYFDDPLSVLAHPHISADVIWMLRACLEQKLFPLI